MTKAEQAGEILAPGIALTQHHRNGYWNLIHVPSGGTLTWVGGHGDQDQLRAAASALAATGIDWTKPFAEIDPAVWEPGSAVWNIRQDLYRPEK